VQVEDYLPAGLEAVDTGLRTTSREVLEKQIAEAERQAKLRGAACRIAFRACFSPFTHAEIRDDRLALFARELPKGAHEYVYFARATTPGTYQVRPSRAAEVYFPDVWGRTDSGVLVVE
jgi:alpha-2-macroglobulin